MNSVIGIVSCGLDGGRQFVTDTYIRAMETAGGIPLVIPCCQEACYPAFTRLCRGFLFCGAAMTSPLFSSGKSRSPARAGQTGIPTGST